MSDNKTEEEDLVFGYPKITSQSEFNYHYDLERMYRNHHNEYGDSAPLISEYKDYHWREYSRDPENWIAIYIN